MSEPGQQPPESKPVADSGAGDQVTAGWMQEIVPFGIFTTDPQFRITSWNEWLVNHSGLAPEEVLGRRIYEVYPELPKHRNQDRYERALAGEVSVLSAALHKYLIPLPATLPESGLPHMLQTARIAPLPRQGRVVGTVTIIEDVTQREFQASILNRQHELDRLLSSALATLLQSDDPIRDMEEIFATVRLALSLDLSASYLLSADESALELTGSSGLSPRQKEALGTLALDAAERATLVTNAIEQDSRLDLLRNAGVRGRVCLPLILGDRLIGLVAFGSYIRDVINPNDIAILGRIARYVAIAIDRMKRERATLHASRAKDDFLAALSHELRTPMNPILLVASDGAANPDHPAPVRESFRIIEKNALLEARLIDDLLDLTRIAHSKLALEKRRLDINATVRDALETVRREIAQAGLRFDAEIGLEPCIVLADYGRLQQVLWNLLKNAVKFTPPGGRILVAVQPRPAEGKVLVSVRDTGIGMNRSELGRVFDAFSQGDHAERGRSHRFGGLGLGLAISKTLIEMHGGSVEALSEGQNLGSTFRILLPMVPVPASTVDPLITPVRVAPDAIEAGTSALRLLLVEDHDTTRASLTQLLERRGYRVTSAATVFEALNVAEQNAFDVVLSDIGLPDGDGFSLMQELRRRHGLRGIALTGYGMEEDVSRSREAGFVAHLTKPVSIEMLRRALDQIVEDAAGAGQGARSP